MEETSGGPNAPSARDVEGPAEERDEIEAQRHHDAEGPEQHGHVGNGRTRGFLDVLRRRILRVRPHALEQQGVAEIGEGPFEIGRDGLRAAAGRLQPFICRQSVADVIFGLGDERMNAFDRRVERARRDEAQQPGNLDRIAGRLRLQVGQADGGEGSRSGLGLPHRLDRGDLHLLTAAGGVAALVAEHDDGQRRGEAEARRHREGASRHIHMATLQNVEGADREHEHRARHIAGADRMHEFRLRDRIEQDLGEGGQLHAHRLRIELGADRIEHPAVCHQNPKRREIAAERDEPGRREMLHAGEAVPAEEEEADEGRLQEEGEDSFNRERRAENVADIMRVIAPIRAELEFHRHAGRDAHRKIDPEERAPEFRRVAPDRASGHHIDALHDRKQPGEAEGQGNEEKVIERGQRELQT